MADAAKEVAALTLSKQAYRRRKRRAQTLGLLRAFLPICFLLIVLLFMTNLHLGRMQVERVEFSGNEHYTAEQLTAALCVGEGDALYGFDVAEVSEALLASCPYLRTVSIEISPDGSLTVTVTERTVRWALEYTVEADRRAYVLLDEQLMALEYVSDAGEHCCVRAPGVVLPAVGETLSEAAVRAERAFEEQQASDPDAEPADCPPYVAAAQLLGDKLEELTTLFPDPTASDAPLLLDLLQPYDRFLVTRSDVCYLLGEAGNIPLLLQRAAAAIALYRAEHPETDAATPLLVDLRDSARVIVRPNPPTG